MAKEYTQIRVEVNDRDLLDIVRGYLEDSRLRTAKGRDQQRKTGKFGLSEALRVLCLRFLDHRDRSRQSHGARMARARQAEQQVVLKARDFAELTKSDFD